MMRKRLSQIIPDQTTIEILARWSKLTPEEKKDFLAKAEAILAAKQKEAA